MWLCYEFQNYRYYIVLTQLIVKHFNPFDNYLTATYLGNLTIDIIIGTQFSPPPISCYDYYKKCDEILIL